MTIRQMYATEELHPASFRQQDRSPAIANRPLGFFGNRWRDAGKHTRAFRFNNGRRRCEQGFELRSQAIEIQGFAEEPSGAGDLRGMSCNISGNCADHNDGRAARGVVPPKNLAQCQPIEVRQQQVHQNHIRQMAASLVQRLGAGGSSQHFILAVPQPELQQLGKVRFIINNKNQFSHAHVLLHEQGAAMTTT